MPKPKPAETRRDFISRCMSSDEMTDKFDDSDQRFAVCLSYWDDGDEEEKARSYKPTSGMKAEAAKGLAWRKEFGRGGTAVGIARARDIANGKELPLKTVKRMHSFFSRHEVDKRAEGFRPGEKGYPSNGRIAWALWGGDPGQRWARQRADDDEKKAEGDVTDAVRAGLKEKAEKHNKEHGEAASKRTTLRTLISVFKRGVGAYRTNPGSVRPNVRSPEQWAYARVNSFLYALRNGKFRSGKHDTDLLPKGHPMSSKKSEETMELEHKGVSFEVKEIDADGRIAGYGSIFNNVDGGGDVVVKGAFADCISDMMVKRYKPKMLWQHDPSQPIGVWDSMKEDERGLFVQGRILAKVAKGAEAIELVRAGAIDGLSIGYKTMDEEYVSTERGTIREIKRARVMETSLVTFPMNPEARVTDVKQLASPRDVEQILRKSGVPNNFAKLVALHGFEGAMTRLNDDFRDGGEEKAIELERLAALKKKLQGLKETINA